MNTGNKNFLELEKATFGQLILALILVFLLCLSLGEIYLAASELSSHEWISIAIVNTVIATLGYFYVAKRYPTKTPKLHGTKIGIKPYLPALGVFVLALIAALTTRALIKGPIPPLAFDPIILGTVFWIPVVEEILFRSEIGAYLRSRYGNFFGCYLSALAFS